MTSIVALLFFANTLQAQSPKKMLDHSVYDGWKHATEPQLTPDGSIVYYEIVPQEGDGKLLIRRLQDDRQLVIPRGYEMKVDRTGRRAVCRIKSPFHQIRKARAKNTKPVDLPKDSLALIDLTNLTVRKCTRIKSYATGLQDFTAVAYLLPEEKNSKKGKRKKKVKKNVLVVENWLAGRKTQFDNISEYGFNPQGTLLTLIVNPDRKNKKLKSSISQYDVLHDTSVRIDEGKAFYGSAAYDLTGTELTFLSSSDTTTTGNKHCALDLYSGHQLTELVSCADQGDMPAGWTVNENSAPCFSADGSRIYLGIAPLRAPKDTSIVDAETAQVDIWNYQDLDIQTAQKHNLRRDLKKTYTAVVWPDHPHKVIPLARTFYERIILPYEGNGDLAISIDETPYHRAAQWRDDNRADISLIDLHTGHRTPVCDSLNAIFRPSPDGRYILWFNLDDSQWYSFDTTSHATVCLTRTCGTAFYDEDNDRPNRPMPYETSPLWQEGDRSVLIRDRYDLWQFSPDGTSALNLTGGRGRKEKIQFSTTNNSYHPRYKNNYWKENPEVSADSSVWLTAFDETYKKNGLGTVDWNRPESLQVLSLDTTSISSTWKADSARVIAYRKGNFTCPYEVYVSTDGIQSSKKLTDLKKQTEPYSWGRVQLVHWKAYDGHPLDGLLYVPDHIDPKKKYPMMVYFYERRSETLYHFMEPAPSRSTINIPFYCSRGYVVFVPDIVYKIGHPGESAYNCIVSGTEAVCRQFPFVDSTHIALQGQSWGGYQTTYLVTRTHRFCAAESGAPVANMTSAYSGIRWESGVARQMQYEHGQSRIGATLWDKGGLALYIENSPLFKADQVQTPLLIMHNDADGAVPWYQGIEYFMALRRLGKPVWMLEYNNETHNLSERRNMKDLSVRLQQFFDHYMKGDPEPDWMKYGVKATERTSFPPTCNNGGSTSEY